MASRHRTADLTLRVAALVIAQKGKCAYCAVRFSQEDDPDFEGPWIQPTFDHVVPKSKGGSNSIRNGLAACQPCNAAKGNRMPTKQELKKLELIAPVAYRIFVQFRAERMAQSVKQQETENLLRSASRLSLCLRPAERAYVERESRALTSRPEPE